MISRLARLRGTCWSVVKATIGTVILRVIVGFFRRV
jgi:hypothetical protein